MDYICGREDHDAQPRGPHSSSTARALAEQLFRAYLKQILVDGFFHADPHPGNVFLTEDDRIALLDLGMVGARSLPRMQEKLLQLLLAVSEGRERRGGQRRHPIGEVRPDFDETGFRRRVAELVRRHQDAELRQMQVGRPCSMIGAMSASGIRLPPELTMLGKTLLNLDQVGARARPDVRSQRRRSAATPPSSCAGASAQEPLAREPVQRRCSS